MKDNDDQGAGAKGAAATAPTSTTEPSNLRTRPSETASRADSPAAEAASPATAADRTDTRKPDGTPNSAGFPRVAATGAAPVNGPETVGVSAPGSGQISHGANLAAAVGATTGPSSSTTSDPHELTGLPTPDGADGHHDGHGTLDQAREKLYEAARQVRDQVGTQARRVSDEVQQGARRATHAIQSSTETGYHKVSEKVEAGYHTASERVEAGYRKASAQLEQGYDQLSESWDEKSTELDRFVRANPGRAVLMVAGAGFLLGLLMRGKR